LRYGGSDDRVCALTKSLRLSGGKEGPTEREEREESQCDRLKKKPKNALSRIVRLLFFIENGGAAITTSGELLAC
jgi:hypothetical protein